MLRRLFGRSRSALAPGDLAPPWGVSLVDASGIQPDYSLDECQGKWVLLYFFPKADTPGCTLQAVRMRDHDGLDALGVMVFGASMDYPDSQMVFRATYALDFPLLADPTGVMAARYGVLTRFGGVEAAKRVTFLIDPGGIIRAVFPDVDPANHHLRVTDALERIRSAQP